jgi:hypothetical protein
MVDQMLSWILIYLVGKHHFSGPENVWSSEFGRDKELRICVGADQCEIIGRRRFNSQESASGCPRYTTCDPTFDRDQALTGMGYLSTEWMNRCCVHTLPDEQLKRHSHLKRPCPLTT